MHFVGPQVALNNRMHHLKFIHDLNLPLFLIERWKRKYGAVLNFFETHFLLTILLYELLFSYFNLYDRQITG